MRHTFLALLLLAAAAVVLAPQPAFAQSGDVPRTAWGKPDLGGVWDFATLTPMERPAALAGQERLTEEDVANIVARSAQFTELLSERGVGGNTGTYDEFWFDFGSDVSADRRTSLVVDPPNGRIPDRTPTALERQTARRAYLAEHPADSWEDRNLAERCLVGFNSGPPMAPSAYNNVFQLFQTEDHVVILNEMVHDARVVPLDGRDGLDPNVRQWLGSSRGYWDGDTLVVETANFRDETNFRGVTRDMRLVERFTRADADTLLYEFTVNDPRTFVRPWTAEVPMALSPMPTFEYACHEGNYGLEGILGGTRAEEREAAAATRD
ncbi:MAG: hypothetical protein J4F30_08325 [Acidobacteria bacterium]|nr:hypothetical protein [Acidobacteriota bacterium]